LARRCGLLRHYAGRGKNQEPAQAESSDFYSCLLRPFTTATTNTVNSASEQPMKVIKVIIASKMLPILPKPQAKMSIVSPYTISG
jgi:hypothetical protein